MRRSAVLILGIVSLAACKEEPILPPAPPGPPPALTGYYRADPDSYSNDIRVRIRDANGSRDLPPSWISVNRPAADTVHLNALDSVELTIALLSGTMPADTLAQALIGFRTRPDHDYEVGAAVLPHQQGTFCPPSPVRSIPVAGASDSLFVWLFRNPREPLPPC